MHHAAPAVTSVQHPSGRGAAPILLARESDDLRAILKRISARDDATMDALHGRIIDVLREVGDRLIAAADGAATGNADGELTGVESAIEAAAGTDAIRAAILATTLDDLAELLADAGMLDVRDEWFRGYAALAADARTLADIGGLPEGFGGLDTEATRATLRAMVERHDDALFGGIDPEDGKPSGAFVRPAASRLLDALQTQVALRPFSEVVAEVVEREGLALPAALTEARTRLAEADAYWQDETAREADPDGSRMLLVYVGADDAITRPFCDALIGKGFTREEFAAANNAQTPTHPLFSRGGYNCRHRIISVLKSLLGPLGYTRGTPADIAAANEAARKGRK